MSQASIQPGCTQLPQRLTQRLEELAVAVVVMDGQGRVHPQGTCRWLERQVIESPLFVNAVQRLGPQLSEAHGAVNVWPGVWLVVLPPQHRRRQGPEKGQTHVPAVLLLGPELLESDQLRTLCDVGHLDYAATIARAQPAAMFSTGEVRRLAAALAWMQEDSLEIDRRNRELQTLSQQLGESYEELSLLYKLSTSMAVNQPPAQFLADACLELQQVLGLKWMAIQLADDEPSLNELAGEVFTAGPIDCPSGVLRSIGKRLMELQPHAVQPLVIDDTRVLGIPELPRLASCVLVVSLPRRRRPCVIIFGGDKLDGSRISSVDSKLCNSLANSLSIFLENMMLYEDMQGMFMGILHALTSSIDAKDSYTLGHSERVAQLTRQLAVAAGLVPEMVERVYISALVHDVGKIGVPEALLSKSGFLTDEEFALIKLHPQIGARILQDIRQMHDLIPGVLYHHERWDGRGYPAGLAGERIPLFGRLISLTDSFDAMSSNRTYRQAMTLDQALAEITRSSGSQFDPALVKTFMKLDFQPIGALIRKHQRQPQGLLREPVRSLSA